MLIIGLTGSIGMGKTATAGLFAARGVPVFDSDAAVHALYGRGGAAVGPVAAAFPEALAGDAIDRTRLAALVLGRSDDLKRLEAIIHPLVREAQRAWLAARAQEGAAMVVLDIPLLFETGGRDRVDVAVVCSAPEAVQRARVLERPGMTPSRLEAILAKQMSDAEKRARADFVVTTDKGLEDAAAQVEVILKALKGRRGRAWNNAQHADERGDGRGEDGRHA